MRELGNKLLLFIICSYIFRFMELNTVVIMAFALSIAVTGLCTYFADGKPTEILLIFYVVLTRRLSANVFAGAEPEAFRKKLISFGKLAFIVRKKHICILPQFYSAVFKRVSFSYFQNAHDFSRS